MGLTMILVVIAVMSVAGYSSLKSLVETRQVQVTQQEVARQVENAEKRLEDKIGNIVRAEMDPVLANMVDEKLASMIAEAWESIANEYLGELPSRDTPEEA